jgi:hypothetical protein
VADETEQPKLLSYCASLYDYMTAHSIASVDEVGADRNVWRGRLVATCDELGIPRGGYNRVVTLLRNLGCIELATRGYSGKTLSEFILHYPPTQERYAAAIVKSSLERLTAKPTLDRLSADIQDLARQLGGINLIDAFSNIEDRLKKLETAVRELKAAQGTSPTNTQ